MLNGSELKLDANEELPQINGNKVKARNVNLSVTSISFITFAPVCLFLRKYKTELTHAGLMHILRCCWGQLRRYQK